MKILIKILCILTLVAVTASFVIQEDNAIYFENAYISGRLVTIQATATGTLEVTENLKDKYISKGQVVAVIKPEVSNLDIIQLEEELRLRINDEIKKCIDKDMTGLEQNLNQLEVEYAKNELQRVDKLYAQSLKSDAELDAAQTTYNRMLQVIKIKEKEHQINLLDNQLNILQRPSINHLLVRLKKAYYLRDQLTITAPYDGYVYENYAYPGQAVELGDKIVLFVPREEVIVEANVLESRLVYVKHGTMVEVTSFIHGKDLPFKGEVISVVPSSTSTFTGLPRNISDSNWVKVEQRIPVRIKLLEPEEMLHTLPIGTSVKVKLNLPAKDKEQANTELIPNAISTHSRIGKSPGKQIKPEWEKSYENQVQKIITDSRKNLEAISAGDCVI